MSEQPAQSESHVSWLVRLQANSRPMPAIPAVAVLFLMVILPTTATIGQTTAPGAFLVYGIAAGIVLSAVLAVAAGLCSFAPPALWAVLSIWALSLMQKSVLPGFLSGLIYAGFGLMLIGLATQIWRVVTGRFVPTLETDPN